MWAMQGHSVGSQEGTGGLGAVQSSAGRQGAEASERPEFVLEGLMTLGQPWRPGSQGPLRQGALSGVTADRRKGGEQVGAATMCGRDLQRMVQRGESCPIRVAGGRRRGPVSELLAFDSQRRSAAGTAAPGFPAPGLGRGTLSTLCPGVQFSQWASGVWQGGTGRGVSCRDLGFYCLSGTSPILALQVPYPGNPLSPRQTGTFGLLMGEGSSPWGDCARSAVLPGPQGGSACMGPWGGQHSSEVGQGVGLRFHSGGQGSLSPTCR